MGFAQGTVPSQTQFPAPSGAPGNFQAMQVAVLPAPPIHTPAAIPTGTVTLFDGGTATGAAVALSAGPAFRSSSFASVFGSPDAKIAISSSPGSGLAGAVWGDFNNDGQPDLVLYAPQLPVTFDANGIASQPTVLQVFLSNGPSSGTVLPPHLPPYLPQPTQQFTLPADSLTGMVQVLDVDGDGKLDLLFGNTVLYGSGDGTFGRAGVLPALATGYSQTYAVDVNGDEKLDIVAVNTPSLVTSNSGSVQLSLTVLRNDGGGTFTSLGTFALAAPIQTGGICCDSLNVFGMVFADLNGDGKPDVIAESNGVPMGNAMEANNLDVLLNNGDGTFGPPAPIPTTGITSLGYDDAAAADLNGDGKLDLVLTYKTNTGNNAVATLLGAGDGTFAAPVVLPLGTENTIGDAVLPFTVEDVNADGNADVVLGSGVLALGNGDGTLTLGTPLFANSVAFPNAPPAYLFANPPDGAAISNAASAPLRSLLFLNVANGANALFVPEVQATAALPLKLTPGTHQVSAHYSGDSTYAPSSSPVLTLTVTPPTPTITVAASPANVYTGESVTLTATFGALFTPLATEEVTFSDGATSLGTAPLTQGAASFTTSFATPGAHTMTVNYAGDAVLGPATGTLNLQVQAPLAVTSSAGTSGLTIKSGDSATTQLTIGGNAGFAGAVSLTCSGLPLYASCNFSPASVTLSGTTPATVTLTLNTAASTTAMGRREDTERGLVIAACGVPLIGMLMMLPLARRRSALFCALLCCALALPMAGLIGCGGGSSSHAATTTPAGSYTFNVVSTSGSVSVTTPLQLTVQ